MTTDDTLARFRSEYQIPQGICEQRQREQNAELEKLAAWLDPKALLDLTQQDLLTYLGEKLSRGLSPNYVRTLYMMHRSFVSWATTAGLIPADRSAMIRLIGSPRGSTANSRPNPYGPKEVRQFKKLLADKYPLLPQYGRGSRLLPRYLQGKTPSLRTALWRHARRLQFEAQVSLALELGLRSKEIFDLTIDAAHYVNDVVVVVTAKQGPGGRDTRQIPWTPHAHARMTDWIEFRALLKPPNDSLWLGLNYQASGMDQLRPHTMVNFHGALRVFGPGWRWHRFRHTAATEWLRAGMPLEKVCVFMGHARLEQTRAYTEILNSDIATAMANAQDGFSKRLGLAA